MLHDLVVYEIQIPESFFFFTIAHTKYTVYAGICESQFVNC